MKKYASILFLFLAALSYGQKPARRKSPIRIVTQIFNEFKTLEDGLDSEENLALMKNH